MYTARAAENEGAGYRQGRAHPGSQELSAMEAVEQMGMGSWRLKGASAAPRPTAAAQKLSDTVSLGRKVSSHD